MAAKVASAVGILSFTAFSAYEVGSARTDAHSRMLEAELGELREREELHLRAEAVAEEKARRLSSALARLEKDYAAHVPHGELEKLLRSVEARLGAGVPSDRLAFVIERAAVERVCDEALESKRLFVRTPLSTTIGNSVGLAADTVTLSVEGESVRDEAGRPETWFDPAVPVTLRFLSIDGDVETLEGVVPVAHSLVFGSNEYRFQAVPDERRGYLRVSVQRCDFP